MPLWPKYVSLLSSGEFLTECFTFFVRNVCHCQHVIHELESKMVVISATSVRVTVATK